MTGGAGAAGRTCPPSYGYSPATFARPAEIEADVVYVIGGLYGNPLALREIERIAACEDSPAQLVFNGDFHWFDADPTLFARVDSGVRRHLALRGNVETEIAGDDASNGCGCAYPETVPDDDVGRSNEIVARLRAVARDAEARNPRLRASLAALPMHLVAQVGGVRVGIVHGDAWALAGWRFAHDALHDPVREQMLSAVFEQAAVDGFASTHTCLPALKVFDTRLGERFVANNGAAGMPNFADTPGGLLTRIATYPVPRRLEELRRYGADVAGVFVDALAIPFDTTAWVAEFDRIWPARSAGQISYRRRIVDGPDFSIDDALGRAARVRGACA
jgi:hypothetical protein